MKKLINSILNYPIYDFSKIVLIWSTKISIFFSSLIILYVLTSSPIYYNIQFNQAGVIFFFSLFNPFYWVFTFAFTSIGLYLLIDQIYIATHSRESMNYENWKNKLLEEVHSKTENAFLQIYISENTEKIFEFWSENHFHIQNKKQLKRFFKSFINENIIEFEKFSKGYNENNGEYLEGIISYSFIEFKSIINYIITPDIHYHKFFIHFKEIYFKEFDLKKENLVNDNK